MRILVTGATGYIGGRLVTRLVAAGHQVRVVVRDPRRIARRAWASSVEIVAGDLHQPLTLVPALKEVEVAYYLVHSMTAGRDFARRDREAAWHFASTARAQGIGHTIYLGGLLPERRRISDHLRSRAEVGEILRAHLPVTEFRAGPIIGSGSASFEMVRYLTERLPFLIAPYWINNEVQPIGVRDILDYLVLALQRGPQGVVDVGGPDRPTFRQMLEEYARARKLRRAIALVPPLIPTRLVARLVGLVTPLPNTLAVPLVEGIIHPVVADTRRAQELFPDVKPAPYRIAVERALQRVDENAVETRWSGTLGGASTWRLVDSEGLNREVRTVRVSASPEQVFRAFTSLGGEKGWLVWEWAWTCRGWIDSALGGPGLRRGRRHPTEVLPGEAVDFWRVEEVQPPRLLRLRAEMKVPGRAWLQWEAIPENGVTRLVQTALFDPMGLMGVLYWYLLYPIHGPIFSDMVRAIAREACRLSERGEGVALPVGPPESGAA
ncbi:MAG: DUF2867 domain-containing protein [Armatimonadetes bacterium]|nr:DUF2867 domain-containing protein [Armatimonadota bacterium]